MNLNSLQNLQQIFPIVKKDGTPTDYFMRLLKGNSEGVVADLDTVVAGLTALRNASLLAGVGLGGGGLLSAAPLSFDLENTAVTPGPYTNANITVDAQGRITLAANGASGGGGITERAIVKPAAVDFALLNPGTATIVNGTNGVVLTSPAVVGANIRFAHWTKAALPVAPYTVIMRSAPISLSSIASKYAQSLILRNAAGTQIMISGTFEEKFLIQRWTSFIAFAATNFGPEAILQSPVWQRVQVTATQMIFGTSPDGFDWYDYSTIAIAGTIGDVAQVGFGCFNNNTVTKDICQSFEVVV